MDKIVIKGGTPLNGRIRVGGAKNSALPLMAASLLTDECVILENVPKLSDVVTMSHLLINHGVNFSLGGEDVLDSKGRVVLLKAANINNYEAPYEIVRKMRASVLVLGPMLARFGKSRVSLPGGCAIGTRPLDIHLNAFKKMGADVVVKKGYIEAHASKGLHGADIFFDTPSVGATENILMAATLAKGKTVINNAAMEPEINDLASMLQKMGAKIFGIGTKVLTINGVKKLNGARHKIISDRIEAGTYAIAAFITGGEITLYNVQHDNMESVLDTLKALGARIDYNKNEITVCGNGRRKAGEVYTDAYPGFPTDMQAQLMSLMSVSPGTSVIHENIFENRYMHVSELVRMGADITVNGKVATIRGVDKLFGAEVMATDLRASVSLVLAALAAKGTTVINRVYHIDRGYERIEDKLTGCGADICRTF